MRISDWSSDVCSSDLVKESVKPINVLLVADADMLDDRFWARTQQLFGQNLFVPIAAHDDFLVNAIDNTARSSDLIGLPALGRAQRPVAQIARKRRDAEPQLRAPQNQPPGRVGG